MLISPIFNIVDIFLYFESDEELKDNLDYPKRKTKNIEKVLNRRVRAPKQRTTWNTLSSRKIN